MEEAIMRLTIVGALLIVAVAILAVLVLKAMLNDDKRPPQSDNTGAQ
jgi:preprotein translocase subunit SecY